MYVEINYEDGSVGVACYEDETEMQDALTAAHARAVEGGRASDNTVAPASRIRSAYVYDEHPDDYSPDQQTTAKEAQAAVDAAFKRAGGENLSVHEIAAEIRDISNPFLPVEAVEGVYDSKYKMESSEQLKPSFWGGE